MSRPTLRIWKPVIPGPGASPGRRRVTAGVGCLLSAVVLALLPLPQGADQAQAAAAEDSSVTKSGSKGTYDDFSDLKVTVHQTKGLRGQATRVTWSGGTPRGTSEGRNFLALMQCWGDDESGPDRTQCEFGLSPGVDPGNKRGVSLPAAPGEGGDPLETGTGTPTNQYGAHYVPFRPVPGQGDPTKDYTDSTYFTGGDTNAIPFLPNDGNGGGDVAFEVKSSLEQPALGCGARRTSTGEVQPCWLVAVPRGAHDPDGSNGYNGDLKSSSLSQSNWDQRILFRLDFEPVGENCDPDKPERRIIGSELGTDAITSWQSELCTSGTHRFTYTQAGEGEARQAVTAPSDSSPGLALTVDPVHAPEGAAQVVQAPVAVSGLTIGSVWMYEMSSGTVKLPVKELKLNQRLLAKVLTQSYAGSLVSNQEQIPDYLAGNPRTLGQDPEFQELNPGLEALKRNGMSPIGLVVSAENSDTARMVWDYILANSDAREFIQGEIDPWGMKVNAAYKGSVISESLDYFPKADLTPTPLDCGNGTSLSRSGLDMVPYANDMHQAAVKVRRGDMGTTFQCIRENNVPKLTGTGRPAVTDQRQFGIVDTPSAMRYQLNIAALPNADGEYVKPTDDSLLKAVAQMPDSDVAGVKAPDPANAKDGAYPLTAVVYAAASVDQAQEARQDYARAIRYAAGPGQTQGTANGQLPYGYAPLPTALRKQAENAADRLERGAPAEPSGTDSTAPDDAPNDSGGPGGGNTDGGTTAGDAAAGGASDPAAAPVASDTPQSSVSPTDPAKQNVAQSGGLTPSEVLGLIRWVLLGVLIAGGVAALAGPVMLRLSVRRSTPPGGGTG
ncbi:hypothetical protein [Streptomyces sp. NPDC058545]|uniref:hypothetical protein n=1 Tax=Streptomyces sp. NPDC058545 TaxID=3346544 RepID=UPI003653573E